jgi:hypothetical protein
MPEPLDFHTTAQEQQTPGLNSRTRHRPQETGMTAADRADPFGARPPRTGTFLDAELAAATLTDEGLDRSIAAQHSRIRAQEGAWKVLPAPSRNLRSKDEAYAAFEALGFQFRHETETGQGDAHFVETKLPDGWSIGRREGSWASYIFDERGICRVEIYDNGQWWDHAAWLSLWNVGYSFVTQIVYGPKPVQVPWDVLTDQERLDLIAGLLHEMFAAVSHQALGLERRKNWERSYTALRRLPVDWDWACERLDFDQLQHDAERG